MITHERAMFVLRQRVKDLGDYIPRIDRKRSWRDSEKAMTKAKYREEMYALDLALGALGRDPMRPSTPEAS